MDWNVIESRQNPAIKFAASLAEKKARDREGVFVAEGTTLLYDFCSKGMFPEAVYLSQSALGLKEKVESLLGDRSASLYLVSHQAFEKITTEKGSEGILSVFSRKKLSSVCPLCSFHRLVALENVQDPGNVGTVIRSAASFGFDGVLLTGCADPFSTKAIRASMGGIANVPVQVFSDTSSLLAFLNEKKVRKVASCLAPDSRSIQKTDLSSPVCVFIGNEGKGLSQVAIRGCDEKSIIPICNTESLNAAAAASIFLWEIFRQGGER